MPERTWMTPRLWPITISLLVSKSLSVSLRLKSFVRVLTRFFFSRCNLALGTSGSWRNCTVKNKNGFPEFLLRNFSFSSFFPMRTFFRKAVAIFPRLARPKTRLFFRLPQDLPCFVDPPFFFDTAATETSLEDTKPFWICFI